MKAHVRRAFVLVPLVLILSAACATAQGGGSIPVQRTDQADFEVVLVADGLNRPWAIEFLPDGDMLVTERGGALKRITTDGAVTEIGGLPDLTAVGQGGLLDVAVHPEYEEFGRIYLSYVVRGSGGLGTAVARAVIEGDRLVNVEQIFEMEPKGTTTRHFGSRMVFLPDGTLLFTIGDRGQRDRAQDLGDHAGSTLRINDDGSVPSDNPFLDRPDAKPEIYSYGHRNAQGMALHEQTGVVWQHEHGPRGGDEVNIVEAGNNYGWPVISYGTEYASGQPVGGTAEPGMEQPVIYWSPSIAPSGMDFYFGDRFPEWDGDLFVGALVLEHLRRLEIRNGEVVGQEVLLDGVLGRIRDVELGPDGYLYLINDANRAGLYRLEPR
jgi:glucose/arabinose dehydrogenase